MFRNLDVIIQEGEHYDPYLQFLYAIDSPFGSLFLSSETINHLIGMLVGASEWGVDYRDVAVVLCYMADMVDTWNLAKMVSKAFKGESNPECQDLDVPGIWGYLWTHDKSSKKGHLCKSLAEVTHVADNWSCVIIAPLVSC
jgi:hypothetical protein